jgi:hypothetical protein
LVKIAAIEDRKMSAFVLGQKSRRVHPARSTISGLLTERSIMVLPIIKEMMRGCPMWRKLFVA